MAGVALSVQMKRTASIPILYIRSKS